MTGLGCYHMFCLECWARYLIQKIVNENQGDQILCPAHQCDIIVDDSMVYEVIGNCPDVKQRFQITVANSFVNCNPLLTWCPGVECNHIVRVARREPIRIDCSSCSSVHKYISLADFIGLKYIFSRYFVSPAANPGTIPSNVPIWKSG